ncbi:MAG: selenide, water dikinase SelD [Synechococcaceae cyanobacterium]|nr:selenide, water dikinase SelD [Synechococcaceae cyanobacterium]
MNPTPPTRELLLAGGGHSHALLLRLWAMRPQQRPAHTRISLVSRHGESLYSGRVPAVVAGLVPPQAATINLRRLCDRAGVVFVEAEITGLDPGRRELRLAGRPPLRFDVLSLAVGAVTATGEPGGGMVVKPLEPFLAWLEALPPERPLRIRGGGGAAVELALALRGRGQTVQLLLRGERLRLGSEAAERAGEGLLKQAGVAIERAVDADAPADLLCTGSRGPHWLAAAGLPVEADSGRVQTEASLEVSGWPGLFASGDCGVIAACPRPASGVWAVRAVPVLADNLARCLAERPLRRWRPQRWALQLLGDGGSAAAEPRALACWGPLAVGPSRGLWRWKEHLDQRFLERLAEVTPMAMAGAPACRGCAAKLAAAPLRSALARLAGDGTPPASEDAALLGRSRTGELWLQSVDGFPALLEDPWRNARLTTLHACSDLWACGAEVLSAQALVTLPQAGPALQEEMLLQTLAGVRAVLDPLGATLLGGHTVEARDGGGLALALSVNGHVPQGRPPWPKGPLQPGQRLLLSRPLGSGVLLAAAMAGAGRAAWIDGMLASLEQSQAPLVALLAAHGCCACTDITGFGLLGHLGEMLAGATPDTRVRLEAGALPAYPGAAELLAQGHASSLAPANALALALLDGPVQLAGGAAWQQQLLVDPQTCGPLLAALPAARAEAALAAVRQAGFAEAVLIGRVCGAPVAGSS